MKYVVQAIGTIVITIVILGLPILTCLSFVFEWYGFIRLVLITAISLEAVFVANEILERSEDE